MTDPLNLPPSLRLKHLSAPVRTIFYEMVYVWVFEVHPSRMSLSEESLKWLVGVFMVEKGYDAGHVHEAFQVFVEFMKERAIPSRVKK